MKTKRLGMHHQEPRSDQYCAEYKQKNIVKLIYTKKCSWTCGVCDPVDLQQPTFRGCLDSMETLGTQAANFCQRMNVKSSGCLTIDICDM